MSWPLAPVHGEAFLAAAKIECPKNKDKERRKNGARDVRTSTSSKHTNKHKNKQTPSSEHTVDRLWKK